MILNFSIDKKSSVPFYKQIVNCFDKALSNQLIKTGDKVPSINVLSAELNIARDTVEKAYRELRDQKKINASKGKGYFVAGIERATKKKVVVLFNKLSAHKKKIYNSFVDAIKEEASVDLLIYDNDFQLFDEAINKVKGHYDYFVVMAHFMNRPERQDELIRLFDSLGNDKLILLDYKNTSISIKHACIYQDFRKDIFEALSDAKPKIDKYRKVVLIIPSYSHHPEEIVEGFEGFCKKNQLNFQVDDVVNQNEIEKGNLYVIVEEEDLVELIKQVKAKSLEVGSDIGVTSYNDTPLKEVLLDGVTIMTTDFEQMGELAANAILNQQFTNQRNAFKVKYRNTF